MKLSWIIGAIPLFMLGVFLSLTIIGAIIGIPLIILSIVIIILALIIPKKLISTTVKLALKVISAALIIFIVFSSISLVFDSGKEFWNKKVLNPVMKPFSEQCGNTMENSYQECQCDGTSFNEDSTNYCYGTCSECSCYQLDQESKEYVEISCN